VIDPKQIHARILSGDRKAEEELTQFVRNRVADDYLKALGPLAEDYRQELCIQVIEGIRRRQVEHPQFLVTYCDRMAANIRIDGLRSAAGAARRLVPIDEGKNRQSSGNIESELILAEQFRTVLKLMEQLDPVSRELVRRFYFERQRAERIERDLRLTPEQFRGRKDRAVRKLRDDYHAMAQQWRLIPGGRKPGGLKAAA
jgi:RNA polymerase sigma factor (sigma-70 family)